MPIEFHRDGLWELPEGWAWTRLGEVCLGPQYGWTTSASQTGRLKLLRTTDISSGHCDWSLVPFCRDEPDEPKKYLLQDGDIVISRAGSVGKSFIIEKPENAAFASYLVRFKPQIPPRYVYWFLQSSAYWQQITEKTAGIAIPNVNASKLRGIQIPIAPFAEQRRIAARIDELFTEIADGEAALARARDDLDTWRRALLKAAVTGELTREWRETHAPNESAADIVNQAQFLKTQFGVRSNRNRVTRAEETKLSELPEIPLGWVWASLSDFAWASSYGTSTKCSYDASGIAVLRIPNIRSGRIDLTDLKRATTTLDLADNDLVNVGDLLIVRTNGSADLIGRAAIVLDSLPDRVYFASYLIRFRIVANPLLRQWIALHLESPVARTWVRKNIASSAGQYNLSQSSLIRMPIPVPPESEMLASLQIFEELESTRENAAADTHLAHLGAPSIRQSILKAAFEGRLVAQDPRDEPADRLLARLSLQVDTAPPRRTQQKRRAALLSE